jgi:cell division protein FtsB
MKDRKIESIKIKFSKLLGYSIWILVAIFLASTIKNINRVISIRKQVEDEKIKVEKMQADNAILQAKITEVQSSDFIEKQIRDKLGFAKSGEAVVILPEESIIRSLAPPENVLQETLPDPNWKKWKKLFF